MNSRVLVVGAGGGIGRELALELHRRGAHIVGTARTRETLDRLEPFIEHRYVLDLADEESVAEFIEKFTTEHSSLDGIVVAAGVVGFGSIVDTPPGAFDYLMSVNANGPINVIAALAPRLSESDSGFVVTLSGMIAETPMAGLAAYSASKSALRAFAQVAAREFRKMGVHVLDARPGHTETGLADRAVFGTSPAFGQGHNAPAVAHRIVDALVGDERDLPSDAFNA